MARFEVGDKVMFSTRMVTIQDVGLVQLKPYGEYQTFYKVDYFAEGCPYPWYAEDRMSPIAPPKHRVVVEIEDPSALKALTGATIVSDTVL